MEWDIVFTGECCNLHSKNITADKIFYKSVFSRGASMYILNYNIGKKLLDIFKNDNNIRQIDWWFNDIQSIYNLKYLWSEPTLVYQGSELGVFKSSLR